MNRVVGLCLCVAVEFSNMNRSVDFVVNKSRLTVLLGNVAEWEKAGRNCSLSNATSLALRCIMEERDLVVYVVFPFLEKIGYI